MKSIKTENLFLTNYYTNKCNEYCNELDHMCHFCTEQNDGMCLEACLDCDDKLSLEFAISHYSMLAGDEEMFCDLYLLGDDTEICEI